MPITVRIQPSEVERVVPNALFYAAIGKRLEDKSLHPRCRAKQFINVFHAIRFAVCSRSRNDKIKDAPQRPADGAN
jgi:hypothetical protein